jgi:hypothetical protein
MKAVPPALAALAFSLLASPAHADSCAKTRDLILASGNLPQRPQIYRDLYKMCVETLALPNVKDAFVLKAGAIAAVPRVDSVGSTASTLAQFCTRFRRGTLHFVGHRELPQTASTAQAIKISPGASTPCEKITGRG